MKKSFRACWTFVRTIVVLLAIYGGYSGWRDFGNTAPPPQYSADFSAGVQDVGPSEGVSFSQATDLFLLATDNPNSIWKLYVFPDAALQEPAAFLDVVSSTDYPLVRFRFVGVTVDCRKGPVPYSFKISPEPTIVAAR